MRLQLLTRTGGNRESRPFYWPLEALLDKTWQLNDIKEVK